jgi:hypothetical protein
MIMPVAEVAYAACNKPMQNDQPEGQPAWDSKWVNTQLPECRPCLAMTSTETIRAMRPIRVKKMAEVYGREE